MPKEYWIQKVPIIWVLDWIYDLIFGSNGKIYFSSFTKGLYVILGDLDTDTYVEPVWLTSERSRGENKLLKCNLSRKILWYKSEDDSILSVHKLKTGVLQIASITLKLVSWITEILPYKKNFLLVLGLDGEFYKIELDYNKKLIVIFSKKITLNLKVILLIILKSLIGACLNPNETHLIVCGVSTENINEFYYLKLDKQGNSSLISILSTKISADQFG